jgi:chorismate synthase
MSGNSFGKSLVLTSFGESHGKATGGILDGFPPGIDIDQDFIQHELNRRKPGGAFFSSPRKEEDKIEILSGIFNGKSTGMPIGFLVYNKDQRPGDYTHLEDIYRPSHADFTYEKKYGIRDYRGGGRSSARETIARVAGGAFVKLWLNRYKIRITGYVSQIGQICLPHHFILKDITTLQESPVLCPDPGISSQMVGFLREMQKAGDTAGGTITCRISGIPAGLGEPVFDKLQADLAKAMLSINAVKGFDYGSGFDSVSMKGSENNDRFIFKNKKITTSTNFSGGIQGGISNGNEVYFRVAFKPVASLMMEQETVNRQGKKVLLKGKGRFDVCVVPRAVVIVEAMAALVIGDHLQRFLLGQAMK